MRRNRDRSGGLPAVLGGFVARRLSARRRTTVATGLTFEKLEPRLQMAVVINEFLASNSSGLMDEDGDRSDWVELCNTGPSSADLGGWYLTDDQNDLTKWEIPSTNLAADEYLVIFASGKDRAVSGQELHASFSLDANGESLLLVMPDGTTIADSFVQFPQQLSDVSFGRGFGTVVSETLVDDTETVRVLVPTNDSLGMTWTQTVFDDSTWLEGDTAIGFERSLNPNPDYGNYFELDVDALMPSNLGRDTAYMRIAFNAADVDALDNLELLMQYDDGFVAYLNGDEIARRNAPGSPAWNSSATDTHSDSAAVVFEPISVSAHLDKLVEGSNVLAIHGLNHSGNRTDFLIGPMLVADRLTDPVIGYMSTPTPGAMNLEGTLGLVADTKFSVDRGFYDAPFNVSITSATAGATIRYTLDGSMPTESTGLIYDPLNPPLITTTTILRAAAFKAGFTPTNVDTQTYVFLDDVIQQDGSGLPSYANWGWAGADWEMDSDIVDNPLYSSTITEDLQTVPTVSLVMPWDDWFGDGGQGIYISGKGIERQASIEYFTADGSEEFQIDAALEIQGGTSTNRWKSDKLSIQAIFKAPYGPTKLDADVFHDPLFDEGATDSFDTLIFDAQLNYVWHYGGGSAPLDQRARAKYIQDQYVADLQNLAGGQAPHGRLVNVYINGLYWGMYMMHERPDDSFAESYLGGDKDDYDVLKHNATTVVAGDGTAAANYGSMLNLVRQDLTVPANYAAVEQLVDIDSLIDYMIINYYVGNDDWAHHNWYATYNRVESGAKWRYHSWDAEHVLKNIGYNAIATGGTTDSPEEVHLRLTANDEYRLRFVDHVQKLFYNGGLLTPDSAAAIYMARMQDVDRTIIAESARWGDNHTTDSEPDYYTREHWLATQNDLMENYFPFRSNIVLNQFGSEQWRVVLDAPLMSQFGGTVSPDFELMLSMPGGTPPGATIYYTLDGGDPRNSATNLPGGSAMAYSGPITIDAGTQVKARIYLDDSVSSSIYEWSPIVDATFLLEEPFALRITELHYHPDATPGVADEEDLEFIELTNTGSQTIDLDGVQITEFSDDGVTIGPGYMLDPGERLIVARNPGVFEQVYGTGYNVFATGYGDANLSNGGERIVLLGPFGEVLQDFAYGDSNDPPWPSSPDGDGPSLEIIDWLGDPSDPANWRASQYVGGSPGSSGVRGDYDGNGVVEQADYGRWRANYGKTVGVGSSGDGNRNGVIDTADYVVWRMAVSTAGSGAANTVTQVDMGAIAASDVNRAEAFVVGTTTPSEPRPVANVVAVDEFFSRVERARPTVRPAFARALLSGVTNNNLLLAPVAAETIRADVDMSEPSIRDTAAEEPIDHLLAEMSDVGVPFELN